MKDIKGFEGLYAITEDGEVWSYPNFINRHRKKGRFLKTWLIGNGYKMVMLYRGEKGKRETKKFLVHRLVALNHIPNPKGLPEINHKDGNRLNNTVDNLDWVDSKENKKHAWDRGLYTHKGSNHYLAKLNENKVKEIKKLLINRVKTYKEIADMFGVTYGAIRAIDAGFSWKHIL